MLSERATISAAHARDFVRRFGKSSNSFMTLYPGFEHFVDPSIEGTVAYVDTPHAWVGGAEPLARPEELSRILSSFAGSAAKNGKTAVLLPVSGAVARVAREIGFHAVMIGSEATFDLNQYPRTGKTWLDVVPTAKSLYAKGARVREFTPSRLTVSERRKLDEITQEWLTGRKMSALGFLNQVDPWVHSEDKRYFAIEHDQRTVAFLAAIPIWARNGWYLVDLIRRKDSPAGSTELLLLQTMRILKESGAKEVTLGVAPLSELERADTLTWAEKNRHPFLYQVLHFIYERGSWFYNFKSLHLYKLKFAPTTSEPMFLVYRRNGRLRLKDITSIFRAFLPDGIARAAATGIQRTIHRFNPGNWIRNQIADDVVVKSGSVEPYPVLGRCPFTVATLFLNLLLYALTSDLTGHVRPEIEQTWGFSWTNFLQSPVQSLALSPFLHWEPTHILFNVCTLLLFTGGLEFLGGTALAMLCYLLPMWLANPMTAGILQLFTEASSRADQALAIDVGASLGVFGTIGAMALLLRYGRSFSMLVLMVVVADTALTGNLLLLNHVTAMGLGAVTAAAWFRFR